MDRDWRLVSLIRIKLCLAYQVASGRFCFVFCVFFYVYRVHMSR